MTAATSIDTSFETDTSPAPQPEAQPDPHQHQHTIDKALHDATRPYAEESRARSWWNVSNTLVLLAGVMTFSALVDIWWARLAASLLSGLLMVRGFILYHDYMHGTILRRSWLAKGIFHVYGALALTPPTSWRYSHNFHHAHVGKLDGSEIGSFPLMTVKEWKEAGVMKRLGYRISRHPLVILFAHITVFFFSICLSPLLTKPLKHLDSAFAILLNAVFIGTLWYFFGFAGAFFIFILPMSIAAALGAYLFYAQHTYEGMKILDPKNEWNYYRAALESSSYLKLGPVMRWFTANIGYHHVHHLNSRVPFYRLPEVMDAIPELQHPVETSLWPRDVLSCLRLSLWDPDGQRLVSYGEAAKMSLPSHN